MLLPPSLIALQHRNFRLIWIGLLLSFSGSMMQNAALLWHVSLLVSPDRKAIALGFVGLVRIAPIIVFSMVSGVVADAMDRRRVLFVTQSMAGLVAVALAVYTGMRKGELFGLRWIDLDLATRRLTVARSYSGTTKSGQARHLRLPTELVPLLQTWRSECPPSPAGLVLPCGLTATRQARYDAMLGLPRLLRAAGCRVLSHPWHALRHSFASHFVMSGGSMLTLSKILGHSRLETTMIYAHLAPDFLADEMDRLKY